MQSDYLRTFVGLSVLVRVSRRAPVGVGCFMHILTCKNAMFL